MSNETHLPGPPAGWSEVKSACIRQTCAPRDRWPPEAFLLAKSCHLCSAWLNGPTSAVQTQEAACHGGCGSGGPRMSDILPQLLGRDGAAGGPMSHFEAALLGLPAHASARLRAEAGPCRQVESRARSRRPLLRRQGHLGGLNVDGARLRSCWVQKAVCARRTLRALSTPWHLRTHPQSGSPAPQRISSPTT